MLSANLDWLLTGPSWIRYRCMLDLLDASPLNEHVKDAFESMRQDTQIQQVINDVGMWDLITLKRHNDASHPLHKLAFLAELGFSADQPEIKPIIANIIHHTGSDDPFLVLSMYPQKFGGSGHDEWLWALCDTPLIAYSLLKIKAVTTHTISQKYQQTIDMVRENGWGCAVSPCIPRFRGPGRKDDSCPYATLLMLKLLSVLDQDLYSQPINYGVHALLDLWEHSQSRHPYLFKMGNDFRKLKVPFVWYDILHVADVLSHFSCAYGDDRFIEILNTLQAKADPSGRFASESIWTKWNGWEFCQKKEPSRWVTLCVLRIFKRVGKWQPNAPHAAQPVSSGHRMPVPPP